MSRNLVLCVLALCVGGALALVAGRLGGANGATMSSIRDARTLERQAWLRLWAPLGPALLAVAALMGWAAQEPAVTDELLHPLAFVLVAPFALVVMRAIARGVRALTQPCLDRVPAATVGLLRPRVVVSPVLRAGLNPACLSAVCAHEQAHARHRDPLRIWLAQLATDLQGASAPARGRLSRWLAALELARDDEARMTGVAGEDLATALIVAARLGPHLRGRYTAVATLTPAEADLTARVHRLLAPLPRDPRAGGVLAAAVATAPAVAATAVVVAGALGLWLGDVIVRVLPIVMT